MEGEEDFMGETLPSLFGNHEAILVMYSSYSYLDTVHEKKRSCSGMVQN